MKTFPIIVFLSGLTLETCYCILLNPPSDGSDSSKVSFKSFLDRNFEFDTSCLKQKQYLYYCYSNENHDPSTECFKVEYYNVMGIFQSLYVLLEQKCEHRMLKCYQGVTATHVSKDHCANISTLPSSLEKRFNPLNGEDYLMRELADRKEMIHRKYHRNNFNTPLPLRRITSRWKYNSFNERNGEVNHAINSVSQMVPSSLFIFTLLCSYVV